MGMLESEEVGGRGVVGKFEGGLGGEEGGEMEGGNEGECLRSANDLRVGEGGERMSGVIKVMVCTRWDRQ